jgi:hypothetical protein
MKTYGPYLRKSDNRKMLTIINDDGSYTSKSYPKHLMEQEVGRSLGVDETVDHIDRDLTNDDIGNFRLVSRSQHSKDDAKRVKLVEIVCVLCGAKSMRQPRYVRGNAKKLRAGPFCGKRCAGKYGAAVQNGATPLPPQPAVDSEYFHINKQV